MTVPQFHDLRDAARRSLNAAQNPKKIILIHTGVVLLLSLLLMLADYLLEQQISTTGGLGGIGMRSALETARSVLQLVQSALLPFWQMGYLFYTLKVAQGNDVGTAGLTEGFRRFGPILRLKLLMAGILFLVFSVSLHFSTTIFLLTPWSDPFLKVLDPTLTATPDPDTIMELYNSIPTASIVAVTVIFLVAFLALFIPVYYRYRMADLWLMDHPGNSALAALHNSRKMMRGNCIAVFKIDLRFWWFFVLDLLVTFLCYGDMILSTLGVTLPISSDAAFYLFFFLYLFAQLGLYYWRQNEISVTYAHLYESLKPTKEDTQQNPYHTAT